MASSVHLGLLYLYIHSTFYLYTPTEAVSCYQCIGVQSASDCSTIVQCPSDHSCFAERSGPVGNSYYTLGCRATVLCLATKEFGHLLGRNVRSLMMSRDVCSICCNSDTCNRHACDPSVHLDITTTPTMTSTTPMMKSTSPMMTSTTPMMTSPSNSVSLTFQQTTEVCEDAAPQCRETSSVVCGDDAINFICRKTCGLCGGPTSLPTQLPTTTHINVGTTVHWSEWNAWECKMVKGSCYMVRHRFCSSYEDECPDKSFSIHATCDPQLCPDVPGLENTTVAPIATSTTHPSTHPSQTSPTSRKCDISGGYHGLDLIEQSGTQTHMCVHVHNYPLTWHLSREVCLKEGGDLVVLDTFIKSILVKQELLFHGNSTDPGYWVGAKDFLSSDIFYWINDQPVDLITGDWQTGQPNNYDGGHVQDCMTLWKTDNYRWHDERCGKPLAFICQKPLTIVI